MTNNVKVLLAGLWLTMMAVAPAWGIEEGQPLPAFNIQAFDGSHYSRAALEGRPVLLIFWNTWCPVCLKELPRVNRLSDKFGPQGLAILAVNTAINDSENKARVYGNKYGYRFPLAFDHNFETGQAFGLRGVPTVILADAQGIVRVKRTELPEDMDAHLVQLLGDAPDRGDSGITGRVGKDVR
jgi:peroxiredoxin